MSKGFLTIAQNSGNTDYIRMAYALALSIKGTHQLHNKFAICVNSIEDVNESYHYAFDHIIEIPDIDHAKDSTWKLENEYKALQMSPFDETVKLDADMLFLNSVDHWWTTLSTKDFWATTNVRTYRGDPVTSDYYRETFTTNDLPNVYTAFMYFKKAKITQDVFDLVKSITLNWETYFDEFLSSNRPLMFSTDVAFALAIKILGVEQETTCVTANQVPTFVHMKSHVQNIDSKYISDDWTKHIPLSFGRDCSLKIGSYNQHEPFHYHIKKFLTDNIIKKLESRVAGK